MSDLASLSRRELQSLAKEHGIRANAKSADVMKALQKVLKKNYAKSADDIKALHKKILNARKAKVTQKNYDFSRKKLNVQSIREQQDELLRREIDAKDLAKNLEKWKLLYDSLQPGTIFRLRYRDSPQSKSTEVRYVRVIKKYRDQEGIDIVSARATMPVPFRRGKLSFKLKKNKEGEFVFKEEMFEEEVTLLWQDWGGAQLRIVFPGEKGYYARYYDIHYVELLVIPT